MKKRRYRAAFCALLIVGILLAFPGCSGKSSLEDENWETAQGTEESPYWEVFKKYGITHENVDPESTETGCFVFVNQKSRSVHSMQFYYQGDVVTGLREVLYMQLLKGDQAEQDTLGNNFTQLSEKANGITGAASQWGREPGYFWISFDYSRMDEKAVLEELNRSGLASIDLSEADQVGFETTREGLLEAGYIEK